MFEIAITLALAFLVGNVALALVEVVAMCDRAGKKKLKLDMPRVKPIKTDYPSIKCKAVRVRIRG